MPEKSNIGITIGYENYLNLASYKVSDFDTVVSENEHLICRETLKVLLDTFCLLFVACTLHFEYECISQNGTQLCFTSRARAL